MQAYENKNFSIIPLKPNSKTPLVPWSEYKTRPPRQDEVDQWFGAGKKNNVGIVTGAISGIVVLDVDTQEAMDAIQNNHPMPMTPSVRTGKGWHFYFRHPGREIGNKAGIMPGVDIRGDGGYVVAPPSVHPDGHVYAWEVSPDEAKLADLPDWLCDLFNKRKPALASDEASHVSKPSQLSVSDNKLIEGFLGRLISAKEGTRNDTLNRVAFELGQYIGAERLPRDLVESKLEQVGVRIGLPLEEVRVTVASGISAGVLEPKHASGTVFEILDASPTEMDRPLRLIDDVGYGATWLPIGTQDEEDAQNQTALFVFDSKGKIYSEKTVKGAFPVSDLPFSVKLPSKPRQDRLLSSAGLKAFMSDERPVVSKTFNDVCSWVDTFVSFENSLADQKTICEMTAAWIMSTYFLDAFDVVGYLWPSGEKGSGKTQFLNTVSRISMLGKTVTAGSSFASLRDAAHYGAVLAFDDCEDLKGMDTSKRELLLAGNTRGTFITHKVPTPDGNGWVDEDVNSFSPRLFSSITIPDEVLNSRTITVPLIRSTDTLKTRLSPTGNDKLPLKPGDLVDALWSIGALHLPDVKACDELAVEGSKLTARDHDIWRPTLAIAYWLQHSENVEGVFERISNLSETFTETRIEEAPLDLHALVLMAANNILLRSGETTADIPTSEIEAEVKRIAERVSGGAEIVETTGAQRIGRSLGSLGFEKSTSNGQKRSWLFARSKLDEIAKAKSVELDAFPF